MFADRLDDARRTLRVGLTRAEAVGEESVVATIHFRLAELEWRAGRWREARLAIRQALQHDEQSGVQELAVQTSWLDALIAISQGAGDAMRPIVLAGVADGERLGFLIWSSMHRWTLGFLELTLGRPGEALQHLDGLNAVFERMGVVDEGFTHYASDELEALILVGREDDAERRIAEEHARAERLDRPRIRGGRRVRRHARFMSRPARRGGRPARARVAIHAAGELPFDHGRSLLALGAALRRGGRRRDARAALEAALAVFDRLGATHWTDKARAEIARLGGARPPVTSSRPRSSGSRHWSPRVEQPRDRGGAGRVRPCGRGEPDADLREARRAHARPLDRAGSRVGAPPGRRRRPSST